MKLKNRLHVLLAFLLCFTTFAVYPSKDVQAETKQLASEEVTGTLIYDFTDKCERGLNNCQEFILLDDGTYIIVENNHDFDYAKISRYDGDTQMWEVSSPQVYDVEVYKDYLYTFSTQSVFKYSIDTGEEKASNTNIPYLSHQITNDTIFVTYPDRGLKLVALDLSLQIKWEKYMLYQVLLADKDKVLFVDNSGILTAVNYDGDLLWVKDAIYGTPYKIFHKIDDSGEFFIGTREEVYGSEQINVSLRKFDSDGNLIWTHTKENYDNHKMTHLIKLKDNRVALLGENDITGESTVEYINHTNGNVESKITLSNGLNSKAFYKENENSLYIVNDLTTCLDPFTCETTYTINAINDLGKLEYSITDPAFIPLQQDSNGNLLGNTLENVLNTFMNGASNAVYLIQMPYHSFEDIPKTHWASAEINYLSKTGIIKGFPDGNFYAEETVTRAQTAIMLARALKLDTENVPNPNFTDIKEGHYAYKEIAAVSEAGIFQGNNGKFDPESKLTRAQMAVVLTRAYNLSYTTETEFVDLKSKSYWAYDAIQALAENRITAGYTDGTFRPEEPLSRAQFSVFMARILDDRFKK